VSDDNIQRAPYPGLRAFRRDETDLFFGREDCINVMVDRLAATRFLAVLGSSGTGKSSLVRTGLLDALELGLMSQAGSRWCIVDFRPGGAPLKNLAQRLLELTDPTGKANHSEADVTLLRAFLARGPRSMVEWCRAGHLPKGTNLLLLVDQFEELFRYQNYAGREEAEAFVALLIESARAQEFPIYAAITMRSEYLGACALIEGLADASNAGMFLTPRMTRDQCREAIVGPAEVCDIELEPGLVNRLLNDLANFAPWDEGDAHDQLDRIMRRADQLPLLQYTLNRMWLRARKPGSEARTRLTITDYDAIGGLSGALNAHANQIFDELGKERAPAVEWVFRALTAGSTIADAVRRPTRFDDLVTISGGNEGAVRAVVDAFRAPGVNFLVPEFDPAHPALPADAYVDISHESLIRQWKKLSEWLEKEGRAAQQWRRLNDRFGTGELLRGRELANLVVWRDETKPNPAWAKRYGGDYPAVIAFLDHSHRVQRKKRFMMTGAAAAVFVLIGIEAIVATILNSTAQTNLKQAEIARMEAEEARAQAEQQRMQAEDARNQLAKMVDLSDQNRQRAEKNYEALTNFLQTLVFNITQKTKDAEINTALTIATETLTNVRKLSEATPNDNELKRYLSVCLGIYGDVKLRMEAVDDAAKAYEEALVIDRALLLANPEKALAQGDLAYSLAKVGKLKLRKKELDEARKLFEEGIDIERRLVASGPNDRLMINLAIHLQDYADVLVQLKDSPAALKISEERVDMRRRLLAATPDDVDRQEQVSAALDKVGDLSVQANDLPRARQIFEEEVAIDRKLLVRDPGKRGAQENLVWSLNRIADLQKRENNLIGSRQTYDESIGMDRKLVAAYPGDFKALDNLQNHLNRFGELLVQIPDKPAALKIYQERLDARRMILALAPGDLDRQENVSAALDKVGELLQQNDDLDGARKTFEDELAIDRKLLDGAPDNVKRQENVVWSLNRIGDLDRDMGRLAEALKSYDEVLGLDRKLLAREPQSEKRLRDLASVLGKIGNLKNRLKDLAGARAAYEEELGLRRRLAAAAPNDVQRQQDVVATLGLLGDVLAALGDKAAALKTFQDRLEIRRKLLTAAPGNADRQQDVSEALYRVGEAMRQAGDLAGARKTFDEMIEIDRKLYALNPNKREYLENLVGSLVRIGDLQRQQRDLNGARKSYQEAVELNRKRAAAYPTDAKVQNNVQSDLDTFAELLLEMDDVAAARKAFEEKFRAYELLVNIRRQAYLQSGKWKAAEDELVTTLGRASWSAMLANAPREAVIFGEEALRFDPTQLWIDINRAHGYLFLKRFEEAMKIYEAAKRAPHRSEPNLTYLIYVKEDFDQFRKLGITVPEMDIAQRQLGF
jgi:tetratricopeptide (TPR) repeat protein